MWGWIARVIGGATGAIDDTIRKWVGALVAGVFGFIHAVFGLVGTAWGDVYKAERMLWVGVGRFARETAIGFYHLLVIEIPALVRWADRFIRRVWAYAVGIYHWTIREFDKLRHQIAAWLDALRRWVITDIWNPIWRTLAPAWKWITHEGNTLWYYLTHPAAFVDLIWNHLLVKLEREAWNTGRLLGRFFVSLILHNVRTFVILIEDIFDAVL